MFKPDWSELPKEILTKISKHLTSEIDVLRFRSVCVSFRSSANLTPPLILKFPFPIIPYESSINPDTPPRFCVLLQSTVYCLRPRQPVNGNGNGNGGDGEGEGSSCQEWLIKVEEMRENVLRLVNPLSRVHIKPLPKTFPKVFNLSDFEIVELCNEYVLQLPESDSELEREYVVESSNPNLRIQVKEIYVRELDNLDVKKVAVLSSNPNSPSANDVYGVMVLHVGGKLAFFKPGDEKWTVIQNQTCRFNDVVQYNGKFYAVDSTGRAVVVDTSLNVSVVAVPVIGGGRKKRLVESDGILFLVDMFIDLGPDYLEWDEFHDLVEYDGDGTPFPTNYDGEATPIRCEVFKLDESKQSWVEVENLGNRVFVVGDRCSFSVPANKLSQCKGNCIIFTDNFYTLRAEDFDDVFIQSIGIYSLEEDRIGPLASYPGYNQLFLVAHISSKACLKVWEGANAMPPLLCLELLSRSDVWPKRFNISAPTDDSIALYFFVEEKERDCKIIDDLVHEMIDLDLALKAVFDNAELLIFPSDQLPKLYWRFRGKYYLWGVFKGKPVSISSS